MARTRVDPETAPATAEAPRCRDVPVPPTSQLSTEQLLGVACVACRGQLSESRVLRGVAMVRDGAHLLDYDVYSCPAAGGTA